MAIDMDRITTRVRDIIPVSWDAMDKASQVNDSVLVGPISYAETYYLGKVPDESEQEELDLLVVEFIAKSSVVNLISPAIDYWMNQEQSITTTGTSETTSFPDRIKALEKLKAELLEELAKLEPIVSPLIPVIRTRKGSSAPRLSSINDELLTPNPQDFGPAYGPKVA